MANNKEGGNETKMKRLKGGEEVCLLSDGVHASSNGKGEEMRRHEEQLRKGINILFSPACEEEETKEIRQSVSLRRRLNVWRLCACS